MNGSCTYIVDLDALQDPGDVKRDNFGMWIYSGSHNASFQSRITDEGVVEIGNEAKGGDWRNYSLRRLHSVHPSHKEFRRMIAFIKGMCNT